MLAALPTHIRHSVEQERERRLLDGEVHHHPPVLVLQVVAVQQEQPAVRVEARDHIDLLTGVDQNGVLPAALPGQHPAPSA